LAEARALIPDAQLSPLLRDWVAQFDQLLAVFGDDLAGATALPRAVPATPIGGPEGADLIQPATAEGIRAPNGLGNKL
jgi:hypothetical protein